MSAPFLPPGLRAGCVPYLNARPLIHGIETACQLAHPSVLAEELFAGRLDVALVPVAAWFKHPEFEVVGGHGIGCDGAVYSVVLAGIDAVQPLDKVFLDEASRTSAALARILLSDCPPKCWSPSAPESLSRKVPDAAQASLLIGDQAISFRQRFPDVPVLDLGAAWKALTGLPFVFALWICRTDCPDRDEIADVLDAAAREGMAAAARLEPGSFEHYYLNEAIRYPVTPRSLEGLDAFRTALRKTQ